MDARHASGRSREEQRPFARARLDSLKALKTAVVVPGQSLSGAQETAAYIFLQARSWVSFWCRMEAAEVEDTWWRGSFWSPLPAMGAPTPDALSSWPRVSCCLNQVAFGGGSGCSAAVCHLKVMPVLGRILPRRPRKARSIAKPGVGGFSSRCQVKVELRFPSPRWEFITSPASRTPSLARARVASSRTWPAPPSRYFPPFKRDRKSTCRRLHIHEESHDVRHLLDAMLTGSRPSFIPASQQAFTEHRCRSCQNFGSCPMTALRISEVSF